MTLGLILLASTGCGADEGDCVPLGSQTSSQAHSVVLNPALEFLPSRLNLTAGTATSAAATAVLRNTGFATAHVEALSISDLRVEVDPKQAVLPPGASQRFEVRFVAARGARLEAVVSARVPVFGYCERETVAELELTSP